MTATHDARSAFRYGDFRYFIFSRFLALIAYQVLMVAVSQSVYQSTKNPVHLGYIGLSLFLPKIFLMLPSGHAADRFDRRAVLLASRAVHLTALIGLSFFYRLQGANLHILYGILLVIGCATALGAPASQAFVTQLVSHRDFNNAVAWNASSFQLASIMGPAVGGWMYQWLNDMPLLVVSVGVMWLVSTVFLFPIKPKTDHIDRTRHAEISWKTVLAGFHYVYHKKVILGAISLDLFAVLFGGATALMPVFANDILHVGATGLGFLRAAPSVGAAIVALYLAQHPFLKRPGTTMLWNVALFGAATIAFGLSTDYRLSLVILAIMGAADMISVQVRQVLVQVETPPAMRGRVSAVNLIFIGASNELGEFESGVTARWFSTVPAVVIGGLGTLAVVGVSAFLFPEIRKYKNLEASYDESKEDIPVTPP